MRTATPLDAFRQAIERAGLTPPVPIIADGTLHRFASNGDRADDAGWYVLYGDGLPAGSFGDWRSGLKQNWCVKSDRQMSATEREEYRTRLERARQHRDADERLRHVDAALRAHAIWNEAAPATGQHPYLQKKGIGPHGLRVDDLNRLLVPVTLDGEITSLQFIDSNGGKQFLPGGKVRGGTFTMGASPDADTLLLCEGFATGASLHEATGYPTICAFSAGNLTSVAKPLRQQFPTATIVISGDHDLSGTGQRAARETAEAVNGVVALPEEQGQDFNDVHVQRGLDAVKKAIAAVLRREQETEAMTKTTATMEPLTRYAHLLDGPEPIPPPRLPQDFRDGRLNVGVVIDGQPYAMRSDREILSAEEFGAVNYGLANVRFSKDGIKRFLGGEDMNGADLMDRLEAFLRRFVVMGEDLPALLALWLVGTHLYMVFEYFPYFVLRSPEKRCGKSCALDLIALLGFNAHQPTASPTEAQIFREPREDGGVQIYDELEE